MGNCQAAEAATAIIQHPGGKVERLYWSVSASEVMGSNPGHYVAVVAAVPPHAAASGDRRAGATDGSAPPVRQLKLLRPDDTLHIGHVYRLISFEEVLKEFSSKKHVKLSKLLQTQQQQEKKKTKRERGGSGRHRGDGTSPFCENSSSATVEHQRPPPQPEEDDVADHPTWIASASGSSMMSVGGSGFGGGAATRHGQWRPSLQSIAEGGS